ncbi:MAG: histidine triad nucleotide-binding protein [Terrimicrobiaceae bacterium]
MTLFQRIAAREIPAEFVHEDDVCFAIRDIHPQAPVHLLVIPKKPLPRLAEATEEDLAVLGHLLLIVKTLAGETGVAASGFRTVINSGVDGGETVPHLHVHLLAGRPLGWPPG